MNASKTFLSLIKQAKYCKDYKYGLLRNTRYMLSNDYSTQNPKEELVVKEKIHITKPVVTQWRRPPFVRDLFLGKFDVELLAFPEILDRECLAEVEKYVADLNKLYVSKVNSKQIDETSKIPDDLIQDLKDMGLFGRMIPAKYGGLELSYTACARLNEVIGLDWSIYSMLTSHEFLASQVILLYGTEEQKNKYLPLLASGKRIAAFACTEIESGGDLSSITTSAQLLPNGSFLINGVKCWVANADIADIFIVFTKTTNIVDPKEHEINVFIVERNDETVFITPHEKICLNGLKTNMVQFKEAIVPVENRIGDSGKSGYEIYLKTLEHFRIGMNSFTFGTLKVLIDSVTEKLINTERLQQSVADMQLVRTKLSKISSTLYAMESMVYFTAAILDSTEIPDVSLESAILKVFNTNGTLYCLRELMNLVGSSSLMKDQHLERFYRDAIGLKMLDGSNEVAKLFIGLFGCKVTGAAKAELIEKERNRLFFPNHAIKAYYRKYRLFNGRPIFEQDLAGHVHPSLVHWGNALEEKLQKFQLAVEEVLANHGSKVMEIQIDPTKLANAAILLYAASAVLSRCSRSYCIGLKNSHHELVLAGTFCYQADQMLYTNINDVFQGVVKNYEGDHLITGGQVIDCKGYFPEHPLKHNL